MPTSCRPLPPRPPFSTAGGVAGGAADSAAVGATGVGDDGWRIGVVTPNEAGCKFYLDHYKPFRLAALQEDPDGKSVDLLRIMSASPVGFYLATNN